MAGFGYESFNCRDFINEIILPGVVVFSIGVVVVISVGAVS